MRLEKPPSVQVPTAVFSFGEGTGPVVPDVVFTCRYRARDVRLAERFCVTVCVVYR